MTHPNAPSTERLREAEELADAILSAAGSSLKYYVPEARTEIVGVAVRKLDALAQENARLRDALRTARGILVKGGWLPKGLTEIDRALNGGTSDAE